MKNFLILILIIISCHLAIAQNSTYGVKGGTNIASFKGNFDGPFDYKYKIGFQIGGFVKFKLTEKLYLQSELLYSLQGTKYKLTAFNVILPPTRPNDPLFIDRNFEGKQSESTIILPILLKYYLTDNLNIEFGPQIDYLFHIRSDVLLFSEGEVTVTEDQSIAESDFNLGLSAGLAFDINEQISVGLRYNYGFNRLDIADLTSYHPDVKRRNSIFSLNLEYRFN